MSQGTWGQGRVRLDCHDNKDWKSQLRDEAEAIARENNLDLPIRYDDVFKDEFTRKFMKFLENVNRKSGECLEKARNVSLLPWRN